jgi:hypothetical protein
LREGGGRREGGKEGGSEGDELKKEGRGWQFTTSHEDTRTDINTHTHTHTHTSYIYIVYICVCVINVRETEGRLAHRVSPAVSVVPQVHSCNAKKLMTVIATTN